MANPSTATPAAASAVDEAVRIAAEGSRRSTESAQAALQAGRRYFEQVNKLNRDLFALVTTSTEAALKTAFEVQNAAIASGQAWLESTASINKDALNRWADVTRQAQATGLKSYQDSAKYVESITVTEK
jgi:hypothetical protein